MKIPDLLGMTRVDAEKELLKTCNHLKYEIVHQTSMRKLNQSVRTEHKVIRQKYNNEKNMLYVLTDEFMLLNK